MEEIRTAGAAEIARILKAEEEADDLDDDDDDDDFEDETVLERIMALSEMFPQSLRNGVCNAASGSVAGVKWAYATGRYKLKFYINV